jgi:hypothetical protein
VNTFVKELKDYCGEFATRCRASRWLGALFHVRVCSDIADDIAANEAKAARKAYDSEQADLLAAKELDAALADGQLDKSDVPAIRRALANINRSAVHDREISSLLSA